MNRKKALLVGILALSVGLVLWLSLGRCTPTPPPLTYSQRDVGTVRAWYDEAWEASGFYRLEVQSTVGSTTNFRYEYQPSPTGGPDLPQDLVITEWNVTGHVHFTGM